MSEETILISSSRKMLSICKNEDNLNVKINNELHSFEDSDTSNELKEKFAHNTKRDFYKTYLSNQFENLIVLSGAGTSVGWGGSTMKELWKAVDDELSSQKFETFCKATGFLKKETNFSKLSNENKDLEKLLSRAQIAREFVTEYEGKPIDIPEIIEKCEKVIKDRCTIKLESDSPHITFLNKVTNRKLKDPRVKIFTLNYDTLFEQAAVKGNFTIIDGFSFTSPRTLSGRNFDYDIVYREKSRITEEESFVPKVFHLYKPHGSVNWEQNPKTGEIVINDMAETPLMIYPKDSKYENSYEQPFFEMMSRLQYNLRKENVLLICLGFSLNDKHIVSAIKEAVTQNPSFQLLIISRTIRQSGEFEWFLERSKKQENVILIQEEFKDFANNYPYSRIHNSSDLK